jgi:hypothetical protein
MLVDIDTSGLAVSIPFLMDIKVEMPTNTTTTIERRPPKMVLYFV